MAHTASIRELRNSFPRIREILEREGEVVLTSDGKPLYKLVRNVESPLATGSFDYWGRLVASQPKAMSRAQAEELHGQNRGDR